MHSNKMVKVTDVVLMFTACVRDRREGFTCLAVTLAMECSKITNKSFQYNTLNSSPKKGNSTKTGSDTMTRQLVTL